ncbi:MAG: hypothetical protein NZ849_04115 [Meiothermus sp.]|nr:hypothetical protein [Meiothermus sp.]MCS7059504.1 hypothetical protein [Meiothermus sp.]MCS7194084.1 hypothetical protein [Meiothermus sp.]
MRVALVLTVLALAMLLLLWRRPAPEARPPEARPAVVVQTDTQGQAAPARPLAEEPLERLNPSTVDYTSREGGRYTLHFVDGSRREVYPFELPYLPEGIRYRLQYTRGGP